jgi:hypothetical protein
MGTRILSESIVILIHVHGGFIPLFLLMLYAWRGGEGGFESVLLLGLLNVCFCACVLRVLGGGTCNI